MSLLQFFMMYAHMSSVCQCGVTWQHSTAKKLFGHGVMDLCVARKSSVSS